MHRSRLPYSHLLGVVLDLLRQVLDVVRRLQELLDQVAHLDGHLDRLGLRLAQEHRRVNRGDTPCAFMHLLVRLGEKQTGGQRVQKDDLHPVGHRDEDVRAMMVQVERERGEKHRGQIHREGEHEILGDERNTHRRGRENLRDEQHVEDQSDENRRAENHFLAGIVR